MNRIFCQVVSIRRVWTPLWIPDACKEGSILLLGSDPPSRSFKCSRRTKKASASTSVQRKIFTVMSAVVKKQDALRWTVGHSYLVIRKLAE